MSKQKNKNIENESKQEKFKRVVEPRAKRIINELIRLKRMASSPAYEITDYDAQKLLDAINKYLEPFITTYSKIANNEPLEEKKETEEISIF